MAVVEDQEIPEMPVGSVRADTARRSARGLGRDTLWNLMTLLVWLGMAVMVMAFLVIYQNPSSPLNPLRPVNPSLVAQVAIPTDTPAPSLPLATGAPTETPVPPTATATVQPSPTSADTPTPGPSFTPTIKSAYPFVLRSDPVTIASSTFPEHDECKLWVAGQTYDLQGAPMVGVTVMLGGNLKGKSLYQLSLTGTALQYGQAGYEFTVADAPLDSSETVWVQLFDQALIPLSGRVFFNTYEDCSRNLVLINFRQVR